ncbi:MAG TPA: glycosyltransferase [Acidimicrobiales bacterium]
MYRLTWPAQVLADAGHNIDLHGPEHHLTGMRRRLNGQLVSVDLDADVIVFQRPMAADIVEHIPVLQAQGTAVVVEVDDDFHALPKGHPARREVAPDRNPRRNKLWLRRACELADLVTVSTPALAERYGSHGRCVILENCVPDSYLNITVEPRPGVFGWTGSTHTHVRDLEVMGDAAARLVDDGHRLHVVGTGDGVREELHLDDRPFTTSGWVPIDRYPYEYARLSAAVCPLVDSRFCRAKSWLKMIEAAALGVPVVASPLPEYARLHEMGVGGLADSPDEWHQALSAVLRSPSLAADVAARGREVVAEWTYERRAWRWAEAWQLASDIRHGRTAA